MRATEQNLRTWGVSDVLRGATLGALFLFGLATLSIFRDVLTRGGIPIQYASNNSHTWELHATLNGSQEVPPTGSQATGNATMTYQDETNTFNLDVSVQGISLANLTGAHIHLGAVGVDGDIIVDLGPVSEWVEQEGTLRRNITNATFPQDHESALLANQTYINAHTTPYPGGEIRGQLIVKIAASPSPSPDVTPTPEPSPSPSATPTSSPTPSPTPQASVSPTPVATPPTTTELKLCKFEDNNGNGTREDGENVLSWKFTVFISGESTRVVESHWWNILNQGCAVVTVPTEKTITVEEEQRSGWRQTALYVDGLRVDTTNHTYTSHADSVKVLWFLDTFTPVGGTAVATPTPTPTPVTTNTQPECVGLSANPTFGGATLTVSFIGKGRDLDGIIRQMEFNFGEGASQIVDVSGETNRETLTTVSHLYRQAGTFNASLRVKDNSGQSNEWSTTPESCKVKIDVQGTILGGTTTTPVTQLPKAGVSEGMTLSYLVSGVVGWGLQRLAQKIRELS